MKWVTKLFYLTADCVLKGLSLLSGVAGLMCAPVVKELVLDNAETARERPVFQHHGQQHHKLLFRNRLLLFSVNKVEMLPSTSKESCACVRLFFSIIIIIILIVILS